MNKLAGPDKKANHQSAFIFVITGLIVLAWATMPVSENLLWRMSHRTTLQCSAFFLKVPYLWEGDPDFVSGCANSTSIADNDLFAWGSSNRGSTLRLIPGTAASAIVASGWKNEQDVTLFRDNTFGDCMKVRENSRREFEHVGCPNVTTMLAIEYEGTERDFQKIHEAITITAKP